MKKESFYRQLSEENFYSSEHVNDGCFIAKSHKLQLPFLSSSESFLFGDVVHLKIVLATQDSYHIVSCQPLRDSYLSSFTRNLAFKTKNMVKQT